MMIYTLKTLVLIYEDEMIKEKIKVNYNYHIIINRRRL